MADQVRAQLRERIMRATDGLDAVDRAEMDETLEAHFRPLLYDVAEGAELTEMFDPGFADFLIGCGIAAWAEMECDRIEGETASF